ncbi:MAG TPA: hypothetical protein VJB05_01855 [archaeon]|nr:hypothetical protein [archaeon]
MDLSELHAKKLRYLPVGFLRELHSDDFLLLNFLITAFQEAKLNWDSTNK